MAQQQVNPLQQAALRQHYYQSYVHLGDILNIHNYENQITLIREQAQNAFTNFDGNVVQFDPAIFDYIDRFVNLDWHINSIRGEINQRLAPVHQLAPIRRREANRILNRFLRVERRRNNLREYLLLSGYAENHQLNGNPDEGVPPIGNGQLPWRFRFAEPAHFDAAAPQVIAVLGHEIAADMVIGYFPMIHTWLNQCPNFDNLLGEAQTALDQFAGMHFVDQMNIFELQPQLFDYINHYREMSDRLERFEHLIDDNLNLMQRIADEVPGVMNPLEQSAIQMYRTWLQGIRDDQLEARTALVEGGFATDDQLTWGLDGTRPAVFAQQIHHPGLGQ